MEPQPRVSYLESVDSTNTYLQKLIADGQASAWDGIRAGVQTAGRGQHGRPWYSPVGESLYLSVAIPYSGPGYHLAFSCALAVRDAVQDITSLEPVFRWPNDILLDRRKLAGILIESAPRGLWIAGIGINCNTREFPEELSQIACSLWSVAGSPVSLDTLQNGLLQSLQLRVNALEESGFSETLLMWKAFDATPGMRIRVQREGGESYEEAVMVDTRGCLVTKSQQRIEMVTGAGEIRYCD